MTKTSSAEFLLSLVMPPEHAAAVAGDFAEASPSHVVFWWNVARTAAISVGNLMASEPRWAAASAWRIALQNAWLSVSVVIAVAVVSVVLAILRRIPGMAWMAWLPGITEVIGGVWVAFALGRWIAEREPRRSLAALTAYTLAMLAFSLVAWIAGWSFTAPSKIVIAVWTVAFPFPAVLFSLAGIVVARRNMLRPS